MLTHLRSQITELPTQLLSVEVPVSVLVKSQQLPAPSGIIGITGVGNSEPAFSRGGGVGIVEWAVAVVQGGYIGLVGRFDGTDYLLASSWDARTRL